LRLPLSSVRSLCRASLACTGAIVPRTVPHVESSGPGVGPASTIDFADRLKRVAGLYACAPNLEGLLGRSSKALAVPTEMIDRLHLAFIEDGYYARPWKGVSVEALTRESVMGQVPTCLDSERGGMLRCRHKAMGRLILSTGNSA